MKHPPLSDTPETPQAPGVALHLEPTPDQFLRLCESLPLAVFETEADDRCLYVNPRWSEITGQIGEQVDGHGWRDAIHPSDREWVLEEVELARSQERMFDADFRVQRPDESIRWVHGRSLPLHRADGTHDGFIHVIYDITDRKLVESQLRDLLADLKRKGDEQMERFRNGVGQLRDSIEEVSEIGGEPALDRERLRKTVEAAEAVLDELTSQTAEEGEDHSLDDMLF